MNNNTATPPTLIFCLTKTGFIQSELTDCVYFATSKIVYFHSVFPLFRERDPSENG